MYTVGINCFIKGRAHLKTIGSWSLSALKINSQLLYLGIAEELQLGTCRDYGDSSWNVDNKGEEPSFTEERRLGETVRIKDHWGRGTAGDSGNFSLAGSRWFSLAGSLLGKEELFLPSPGL